MPYVNQSRTKEERRARYCFLTCGCGFDRNTARRISSWTDAHMIKFLTNNGVYSDHIAYDKHGRLDKDALKEMWERVTTNKERFRIEQSITCSSINKG